MKPQRASTEGNVLPPPGSTGPAAPGTYPPCLAAIGRRPRGSITRSARPGGAFLLATAASVILLGGCDTSGVPPPDSTVGASAFEEAREPTDHALDSDTPALIEERETDTGPRAAVPAGGAVGGASPGPTMPSPAFAAGDRRFSLEANHATQTSADTDVVRLDAVRLVIFDSLGAEVVRLRADEGEFNHIGPELIARGNVVVDVVDGDRRLLTEELRFLPEEDRIWSPVRSTLIRPGLHLEAERFSADSGFHTFEMWGARGTFKFDPPEP
jgi:LPS export ABC transporter protein LptC